MIAALLRYPRHQRRAKAQEWARRSHQTQQAKRLERGPDWETLVWQAKQDTRGQIIRHGITYSTDHPNGQPWTILRSKRGRTNQVDLHLGDTLAFTGSLRTLTRAMQRTKL